MAEPETQHGGGGAGRRQNVKCVVWDLDNTLWEGVLLEDDAVRLRPRAAEVVRTLSERGILHSVASRNDARQATEKLQEFGLDEYFLYPQINWNSKVSSVEAIAAALNIGLDAVAFVDDDPFERGEMSFSHPDVLCIDAADLPRLASMPELTPVFVTADARRRHLMYRGEMARKEAEAAFTGPQEEFLAGLGMVFEIGAAREDDLERAEELTMRTHQLNSTGVTYSFEELDRFRRSDRHQLLVAGLEDRYGSYGKIGLALVECDPAVWTIKLLLMSCRVMSRGVGTLMLGHIMRQASEAGARLRAEFLPNERNRVMYVTYKFGGFKEAGRRGDLLLLESDLSHIRPAPAYVQVLPGKS